MRFEEIAPIVEPGPRRPASSPAEPGAAFEAAAAPDADLARQREVVAAFLAASRAGDSDALVAVLDPDKVADR